MANACDRFIPAPEKNRNVITNRNAPEISGAFLFVPPVAN
jgi:hypothetical protein